MQGTDCCEIQSALHGLRKAVAVIDADDRIAWSTTSYARLFGRGSDLVGLSVYEIADRASNEAFFDAYEAVRRDGECREVLNVSADFGGSYLNTISLVDGLLTIELDDVTARVAAEHERSLSQSAMKALFELNSDVVVIGDFRSGLVLANDRAHAAFGDLEWLQPLLSLGPEEEIPSQDSGLQDPENRMDALLRLAREVWQTGESRHITGELATHEGVQTWDQKLSRWEFEGERRGVIFVGTDVSELLDSQRQNIEYAKREAAAVLVQKFAQGVAHDFGNVAQLIDGYAYMLQVQPSEESARQAGAALMKASTRAVAIASRIATIARMQQVRNTRIDISELVRQHAATLQAVVGPDIVMNLDLAPTAFALANGEQIESALDNLCSNAARAMEGRGRISIAVAESIDDTTHLVELIVADNGPGIPDDALGRLFEPFSAGEKSRESGGTGLGLYLLHDYVRSAGGTIDVETGPSGTIISIRLQAP